MLSRRSLHLFSSPGKVGKKFTVKLEFTHAKSQHNHKYRVRSYGEDLEFAIWIRFRWNPVSRATLIRYSHTYAYVRTPLQKSRTFNFRHQQSVKIFSRRKFPDLRYTLDSTSKQYGYRIAGIFRV